MPLDLTDAELATACRALAYQKGERAKALANPTVRGPLEYNAKRYAALAEKLEGRARRHTRGRGPGRFRCRSVRCVSLHHSLLRASNKSFRQLF